MDHEVIFVGLGRSQYIPTIQEADAWHGRLVKQIEAMIPTWSMAPLVAALRSMRGIALITAATIVAEIGDLARFATPRRLMAYLGLVPPSIPAARRSAAAESQTRPAPFAVHDEAISGDERFSGGTEGFGEESGLQERAGSLADGRCSPG